MSEVRVCPLKDRECGDIPLGWCNGCPISTEDKPTHYAVMGNGHIIHAVPADGLEGGKERCERFIDSMRDLPEAKGWTVKGVTVHA